MNDDLQDLLNYLARNKLYLTTAESCTAGLMVALLAEYPGCGESLESGQVVYSPAAKKRLLGVRQETLDTYNLSSEEVAREMAIGALNNSPANVAIATTGVAGPQPRDGIAPGTLCCAWAFRGAGGELTLYSSTEHIAGNRSQVLHDGAKLALLRLPEWHARFLDEQGHSALR